MIHAVDTDRKIMVKLMLKVFSLKYTDDEIAFRDYKWEALNAVIPDGLRVDSKIFGRIKKQALKEIDEEIRHARSVGKSPYQLEREQIALINQKIDREHALVTTGYSLTEEDYRSDIFPILCRYSFFPEPGSTAWNGETVEDTTYILSSEDYRASGEARDNLLGICDVDALTKISRILRRNYEKLRGAELAGHNGIIFSQNNNACDSCNTFERYTSVQELLAAYRDASIEFPHELPWEDEVQYCEGPCLIASRLVKPLPGNWRLLP